MNLKLSVRSHFTTDFYDHLPFLSKLWNLSVKKHIKHLLSASVADRAATLSFPWAIKPQEIWRQHLNLGPLEVSSLPGCQEGRRLYDGVGAVSEDNSLTAARLNDLPDLAPVLLGHFLAVHGTGLHNPESLCRVIDKFDTRILSLSLPWSLNHSLTHSVPMLVTKRKGKHPCQLSVWECRD